MLGLVRVDADFGAEGHSDGDAAAHAVCDALLGAMAAGDMGRHFPSSEHRWSGVDSAVFVAETMRIVREKGGEIVNLDLTLVLEEPRLSSYIEEMRQALAATLGCPLDAVSVKAKTADGSGEVGAGKAVEARAVVLVEIV